MSSAAKSYAVDIETGIDALLEEIEAASAELKQALEPDESAAEDELGTEGLAPSDAAGLGLDDVTEPEPVEETAEDFAEESSSESEVDAEPEAVPAADAEEMLAAEESPGVQAEAEAEVEAGAEPSPVDIADQVAAMLENATESADTVAAVPEPSPASEQPEAADQALAEEATAESPADEAADEVPEEVADEELAAFDAELAETATELEEEDDLDAILDGSFEDSDGTVHEASGEQVADAMERLDADDKAVASSLASPVSSFASDARQADEEPLAPISAAYEPEIGSGVAPATSSDTPEPEPKPEEAATPAAKSSSKFAFRFDWASLLMRVRVWALSLLKLMARPLLSQQPIVRDAVGWVASYTVFMAACVWVWHLWFQSPAQSIGDVDAIGLVGEAAVEPSGDATETPGVSSGSSRETASAPTGAAGE